MGFVHPWAVGLGAAALALPVAIHLLTRPRPRRMPLSAIRFVRDALRERRARHRLRNFLILSLRMAAIALLALAIARPLTSVQPLVSPDAPGAAPRVVILDVSQSMAALSHGVQQIERARPAAETF